MNWQIKTSIIVGIIAILYSMIYIDTMEETNIFGFRTESINVRTYREEGETSELTSTIKNKKSVKVEYTVSSRKEEFDDGTINAISYLGARFHQNSSGDWVYTSDVFRITRFEDDLTFHYDGIQGALDVTFEAGVINNGNYLSMSKVKTIFPQIKFDFPKKKYKSYWKYAVNITNIPVAQQSTIEAVTLTYKSHNGFNLSQLTSEEGKRFVIKGLMKLGFNDLKENDFTLRINKSEKRLYIGNLSDKFVDNSLFLDPTLAQNFTIVGGTGRVGKSDADWDTAHDAATGSSTDTSGEFTCMTQHFIGSYSINRCFFPINITPIASSITVHSASLCVSVNTKVNADNDDDDFMIVVGDTTQVSMSALEVADYNKAGAVHSATNYSTPIDLGDISTFSYNCFNITSDGLTAIETAASGNNEVKLSIREGHDVVDSAIVTNGFIANSISVSKTNPSYLNFTYSEAAPEDSCTCPSAAQWDVTCSDDCSITEDCDITGFPLNINGGGGSFEVLADIYASEFRIETCNLKNDEDDGNEMRIG